MGFNPRSAVPAAYCHEDKTLVATVPGPVTRSTNPEVPLDPFEDIGLWKSVWLDLKSFVRHFDWVALT
jgi:hypothetical protein